MVHVVEQEVVQDQNALVPVVQDDVQMARLNVTWGDYSEDLPNPIRYDLTDEEIKAMATEAVRGGAIPGIPADPRANFTDFAVRRPRVTEATPVRRIMLAPKTAFGAR